MKKALLIGLLVCVLALGAIGAAFATGLNFPANPGSLSTGYASIPQVNVTQINPGVDNWSDGSPLMLDRLWVYFDQDLNAGTSILVDVYNASWVRIGTSDIALTATLAAGSVHQADLTSAVPVANVYHIRVSVGEPWVT